MADTRAELLVAHTSLALPELGVHLEGASVAGVETWLRIPEWALAIDVGRSPEQAVRCRYLALTHAHMDHAGGLAQYLAMRKLYGHTPTTVFAPAQVCDELHVIVRAWERLHGSPFDWTLVPMEGGDEADLGHGRRLRAFAVDHVVPALGYAVVTTQQRLKREFKLLDEARRHELRVSGVELSEPVVRVLLAASGDTRIDALETAAELRTATVVALETTFLDARRSRQDARFGGHVHLSELAERAELLADVERWVPYHISQIYSPAEAWQGLREGLPEALRARATPLMLPLATAIELRGAIEKARGGEDLEPAG